MWSERGSYEGRGVGVGGVGVVRVLVLGSGKYLIGFVAETNRNVIISIYLN